MKTMGRPIEYKMPKETAKQLIAARSGPELKKDTNKFLVDYVNTNYGLLGVCRNIILY
jgi:hypothetical protein